MEGWRGGLRWRDGRRVKIEGWGGGLRWRDGEEG